MSSPPASSGDPSVSDLAGCDLHLDCPSGLAGDMFLGACIDLGLPLPVLAGAVEKLRLDRIGFDGVSVEARRTRRGGIDGVRFRVLRHGEPIEGPDPEEPGYGARHRDPSHDPSDGHDHDHGHDQGHDASHDHGRTLPEIRRLIAESELDEPVRERSLRMFEHLGAAEAKAHGVDDVDDVHFHEVGAVDSIVDLVGAATAIEYLAPRRVTCGPVNVGGGTVQTAHGELPVPPPAAAAVLAEVAAAIYGSPPGPDGEEVGELLTPTGAVLLAELVDRFGPLPSQRLLGVGQGHGRRELPGRPNSARILRCGSLATDEPAALAAGTAWVNVIETEIDDLPGEGFGHLMERLLAAGALDVYFTPVQMKKNRPGTLVTVLTRPAAGDELAGRLITESGSLGCRLYMARRLEAERRIRTVVTRFGEVRVKSSRLLGRRVGDTPEYEDCRRVAQTVGVPWREVYAAALAAAAEDAEGGDEA